jgi:hypothetical protein
VQSLAILEVVARPGWSSQAELCVACLRVPEGSVVDLGIGRRLCGVRVPSVISSVDHNVLLDPRQADVYTIDSWALIPFDWLVTPAAGGLSAACPGVGSHRPRRNHRP